MEQRILKYRKQIDEWLAEMEQNMQAQSQEGGNAEQITQELVRNKLKEHLVQVGFF